jgi:hypothetical protein
MGAKKSLRVESLSVSVRLRRTTVEEAYVSVLVTDEMWKPADSAGKRSLDADKVFHEALEMGADADTAWMPDGEPVIEHHPIQNPPPYARPKPN